MNLLITGAAKFNSEQIDALSSLGYVISYQPDESAPAQTDFAKIDALVANGIFLHHDLDEFESLRFIQLTSAGMDRVPLDRINEKNIEIHNARGVYSVPIAEYVVGEILNFYKGFNGFFDNQKNAVWNKNRNAKELAGSKVAIVGCGSIGKECAKRLKAFDTRLIGVDIQNSNDSIFDEYYDIDAIKDAISDADIIVLALPLTDETKGIVDISLLQSCKKDAVIVNISRGDIINEEDLTAALKSGLIGGAILDVFQKEPLSESSPLWEMDNVIVTPHNSFVSDKNTDRLFDLAYQNLKAFIEKGETK